MTQDLVSPSSKPEESEWQSSHGKPGQCAGLNIQKYIITKHVLTQNRMVKLSHPLFEGGTAEVALDHQGVPLATHRRSRAA